MPERSKEATMEMDDSRRSPAAPETPDGRADRLDNDSDRLGVDAVRGALKLVKSYPWITSFLFAGIVLLQVLVVARGDVSTVGMLLGSGGVPGLMTVIILLLIPGVISTVLCTLITFIGATWGAGDWRDAMVSIALTIPVVLLGLVFMPWISLIVFVVMSAVLAVIAGVVLRKASNADKIGLPVLLPFVATVTVLGFVIAPFLPGGKVWMPTERLEVVMGGVSATYIGYVIDGEGERTTILLEEGRTTLAFDTADIESRVRCQLEPPYSDWKLFMGLRGSYPDC